MDSFEPADLLGLPFRERSAARAVDRWESTRPWWRCPVRRDPRRRWKSSCSATRSSSPSLSWHTKPESGRRSIRKRLSLDVATFFDHYDHLESLEPGPEVFEPTPAPARYVMPITFGNLMYGTTEGAELSVNLELNRRWTLSPGYAFLEMHLHTQPTSLDTTSVATYQGSSPQHQAQLRSHVELLRTVAWDASAFFVSALPSQGVNSYTRVDTQLTWKFAEKAEFSLVGQNLLQSRHLESNDVYTLVNPALIRRSAYAKITWRF